MGEVRVAEIMLFNKTDTEHISYNEFELTEVLQKFLKATENAQLCCKKCAK